MRKSRIEAAWKGQAECAGCTIRDLALFADLQEDDFDLIHLPIDELEFGAGSTLYNAGDEGRALFTVRSGLVKLVQYLPDGGQRIVRLLRRGDTAGLEVLVGEAYEHSAVVLRPALVCRLPREVVKRLSVETPRLHTQLMKRWHAQVRQADEWLTGLSTGSARSRVARLFLHLAEVEPACTPEPEVELFSREDLGAMLGVTTETASRVVADFKRSGLVTEVRSNRFRCHTEPLREAAGE
nr:Crp/Fnr family transcriptional regulator [Caenispirillum salinarum]